MLRTVYIMSLLLFAVHTLNAQDNNIATERLNIYNTADVISKGSWHVEAGFRYASTEIDFYRYSYLQSPSVLQRVGISNKIELRLRTTISSSFAINTGAFSTNYYDTGLEPLQIGSKIALCKQKKYLPKISVLTEAVFYPLASSIYSRKRVAPTVRFLFSHNLNNKLVLGYNLGSFWNGQFGYTYDVYLQTKLSPKHITNIEYAGYWARPNEMTKNRNQYLYGSFGYYIAPRVLCDVGLGRGLGNAPDYFFKAGISFKPIK